MIEQKVTVRNYRPEDLPEIAAVYRAVDLRLGREQVNTVDTLRVFAESQEIDAANDLFVVEHEGRVIGYADLELNPATGHAFAEGIVHPDFWQQGIGTELIRISDARILAKAEAVVTPDLPVWVQRNAYESSTSEIRLLEAQGYTYLRTFYRMRIDLAQPMEVPPLPSGIVLRPFERDQHAYAVYQTQQETFADHWQFEPNSYEEWSHYLLDAPNIDFSMWVIAFDEATNEIAGICINGPYGENDPQMAWTRMLGVRRSWRKHGLGMALLKQSFALFQSKGYVRSGLGVDASSPTNAVALYERAGMHIHKRVFAYQKYLRGDAPEES